MYATEVLRVFGFLAIFKVYECFKRSAQLLDSDSLANILAGSNFQALMSPEGVCTAQPGTQLDTRQMCGTCG